MAEVHGLRGRPTAGIQVKRLSLLIQIQYGVHITTKT